MRSVFNASFGREQEQWVEEEDALILLLLSLLFHVREIKMKNQKKVKPNLDEL